MPATVQSAPDEQTLTIPPFSFLCRKKHGEFAEETIDALFKLNQTKKLLNAIYGCMATAPVRTEDDVDYISYYNGDIEDPYTSKRANTLEEKQEQLDKYYNSRNSFLPYQCGVMVTSLARYELYEYIKAIGYEYILYCDTDSASSFDEMYLNPTGTS